MAGLKRYKYKTVMVQFWEGLKGIPKKLAQRYLTFVGMIITGGAVYALVCVLYRLLYDLVLFLLGYGSLEDVFVPLLIGLFTFTVLAVPAGLFLVFIGLPLTGLPFYLTERLRIGEYIPRYIGFLILGAVAALIGAVVGGFVFRGTSLLLLTLYPEIFSSVSPIEPLITENGVPQSILHWLVIAGMGIGAAGGLVFWYQRREAILKTRKTTADKRGDRCSSP